MSFLKFDKSGGAFSKIAPLLIISLFFLIAKDLPFFWDSIIHSAHAQNFSFWAPTEMDFGHPPLFNFLLLGFWSLLGKSLWSAHLLTTAISIAIFIFFKKSPLFKETPWFLLLLEPVFLAMNLQISADLLLLLLFLLATHFIVKNNKTYLTLCLCLLVLTSMRGSLIIPSLIFFSFYLKNLKNLWPAFLIAISISTIWFIAHYIHSGWLITPPNAAGHRSLTSIYSMIKNFVLIIWYFLDYGRIFIITITAILIFKNRSFILNNSNTAPQESIKFKILLVLIPTLNLALIFIPLSNPIGERYFLIPFVFLVSLFWPLTKTTSPPVKKALIIGASISVIIGSFFIYPKQISQNWDSNLAHYFYQELQSQFEKDFLQNSSSTDRIYAEYPNYVNRQYTHLNQDFSYNQIDSSASNILSNYFYTPLQNGLSDQSILHLFNKSKPYRVYSIFHYQVYWFKNIPKDWF